MKKPMEFDTNGFDTEKFAPDTFKYEADNFRAFARNSGSYFEWVPLLPAVSGMFDLENLQEFVIVDPAGPFTEGTNYSGGTLSGTIYSNIQKQGHPLANVNVARGLETLREGGAILNPDGPLVHAKSGTRIGGLIHTIGPKWVKNNTANFYERLESCIKSIAVELGNTQTDRVVVPFISAGAFSGGTNKNKDGESFDFTQYLQFYIPMLKRHLARYLVYIHFYQGDDKGETEFKIFEKIYMPYYGSAA